MDSVPGHIYWLDKHNKFIGCNKMQADAFGLSSSKEITGRSVYDFEVKKDADHILSVNNTVLKTGNTVIAEEPFLMPNGEERIYLSKKTPLKNNKGEIIGTIGISFDITEQKRTERKLIETEKKLEGMTLVSASIAHEIRTPLATINFRAKNIQYFLGLLIDAYEKAFLANIELPKISNKSLDKLKDSLKVIENEILGTNTFLEIMLMNLQPKFEETKVISISQCIEEALSRYPFQEHERARVFWKNKKDFKIKCSQLLLVHVLFNLLKNALYYTHHKGDIKIWLELGNESNKLYFKDTGEGIKSDILPHIFEQFFSNTYHGAGIGLTFCKLVMESLGGSISCESEEGSYTQFKLSFPKVSE